MHTKIGSLLCVGWALSLASGCDDQVAPGYYGQSLLSVTGSCVIENSHTQGELTPALAFDKGPVITIVDVPVQGTFPSKFRLEMYEPPPESTLHHPTRQEEGEPLVSIGHITAVTSDHPEKLYVGNSLSVTVYDCKDEGRTDNMCLDRTEETCPDPNVDKIPCYVEKRYCPKGDRESDQCIVEKSGDPDLVRSDVYTKFAGLSQNYEVIYLAEAAAPGSATAAWLEAKGGVPAGYGLYEVTPLMGEEADEYSSEDSQAWELAAQYYNEAHGTDYESVKCEKAWDAPFCTMPSEDIEGRTGPHAEIDRLLEKAKIELGRSISGQHYKRVDDPANTAISIVIDSKQAMPLEPPTQP
jgi:hypothetical protein